MGRMLLYWCKAGRRVAARYSRMPRPLPARHLLAFVRLHTADIGAARYCRLVTHSLTNCFLLLPPPRRRRRGPPGLQTSPRLPAGPAARDTGPDRDFQVGRWLVTAGLLPGQRLRPFRQQSRNSLVYIAEPGAR